MSEEKYTTVKVTRIVLAPYAKAVVAGEPARIAIDVIGDNRKPQTILLNRNVAARVRDQNMNRDHENNYTFYIDRETGEAVDLDRESKNPNLPVMGATATVQDDDEKRVILEINHVGRVTIGTNINMPTEMAAKMREAVQEAKDADEEIREYDILKDAYLVVSVRNEGRRIHVKLNH